MKTVEKIIMLAKNYMGAIQGDSIHKEIIDKYNEYKPLPRGYKVKYTDAWCATFISSLSIQLGYTDIIPPECSCYWMIKQFKELGVYKADKDYIPKVGDIIFYDWDNNSTPDHVGLVEKCEGHIIVVIEGNRSKRVDKRTLEVGSKYIYGYAIPKYDKPQVEVSEWAINYWNKAIQMKIIDGTNPKGIATREQVITILGRLGLLEN